MGIHSLTDIINLKLPNTILLPIIALVKRFLERRFLSFTLSLLGVMPGIMGTMGHGASALGDNTEGLAIGCDVVTPGLKYEPCLFPF